MRLRVFAFVALVALAVPLRAEDKVKAPTLTLRVKGLDELLADAHYLANQAGQGEELKQAEGLLKAMTGEKGLEGLDTRKPMALYAYLGAQGIDSDVVLMLPIADQKTFLKTLNGLNIKTDKQKNGIYEVQPEGSPMPVYFRFAHGYVYGTIRDADVIGDKRLLRPATVLPADEKDTLSVSLDLGGFPKELRDLVVGQLNLRAADFKEKKPGETQAQADFRAAGLEESVALFKSLLTDSGTIAFRFGIDRKAGDIAVSLGLAGQKNSSLAKTIATLGMAKSVAASAVGDDSATATRVTFALSDGIRKALAPVIDEGVKKMLADLKKDEERELLAPLVKAITPTLKEARFDAALDFRGPSDKQTYTIVGALGIKGGSDIEKEVKAILKKLPREASDLVTLDVAKSGDVNVHKLNIAAGLNADAKKSLGDDALYFAVRDDAVFFAVGESGLSAIKDAVQGRPKSGPVLHAEMSMLRMASLMAAQQKAAPKVAQEAFGKARGNDRIFLSLEGGQELRFKLSMKGPVLRFFNLLDAAEKKAQ